jgi:5'-phosphate synthase pdxT subunit
MTIGILAVQGAFAEHAKIFELLGEDSFFIRKYSDLDRPMDGLVIPGGESTSMLKILEDQNMKAKLSSMISEGLPAFGTCAGLIMLSDGAVNDDRTFLGTMPIKVRRNAFGRQLGSFSRMGTFDGKEIPMEFIRAPVIESCGKDVEVLSVVDGKTVAARYKNQLVTAFHPELTEDTTVHGYFLNMRG